jgi:C4-dicarboxylate-binding protein DctP
VQDGVTETNHGIIDYLVVTSVDWLDSLEPAVREQFLTISLKSPRPGTRNPPR